ncbi:23S rRNA (adenine(1618)-N(6))-methyltransferase RlmF [Oceanospirillum sediminis]|uniref:Ribosomal RNA large subunit methyltransferase F n=1 Tax=Oceanospirillum sediminis TaxID=2760088 RepID=A0A839IW86_9GAMM|nr:23S rRNA (adenine(1618)-N(6))-methyltransferase RlmF [Oceanospirillum sediminis]MBB1489218.1 23S rRNA (adenine(1618)-N(6))-methyltransferase RlmF [Oceanospirillum sediminis]
MSSDTKKQLHPRNPHNAPYDFNLLKKRVPELSEFIEITPGQNQSIDFSNPEAVKALNQALLKQTYKVAFWDIPEGYLCPAIPGRADYIHYIADLLAVLNNGNLVRGKKVSVLDIGTGASCVYPIIGSQSYGWSFIGSDIDPISVNFATQLVKMNRNLSGMVRLRRQLDEKSVFHGIIKDQDLFELTMCNPPFHKSAEEATSGTERKQKNLQKNKQEKSGGKVSDNKQQHGLNFGGQNTELWCEGGEIAFLKRMIRESADYAGQCLWFTSLVSKKENLDEIYSVLKKVKATQVKTMNMAQGQKISRVVAWSFLTDEEQIMWAEARWTD